MTCLVMIEFRAKPDCIDKVPAWLATVLPATRASDGCVSLSVTRNQDDHANFVFVEQWASRQHYERYLAWRTETGVLNALAAMVDGEASFRFFDYVGL